jgi:small subunit ribosomal protein S1
MVTESTKATANPGAQQSVVDLDFMTGMDALMEESTAGKGFAEGSIIQGTIVEKRDSGVLVDIGYKAEGIVPKDEFSNWAELEVGQQIDVFLELIEDEDNMPVISVQKAELNKAWTRIVTSCEEGNVVKGIVRNRVKGGFIVDIGVEAFLPGSQIDVGPVRNMEDYIGKEFDFKVLKINPERRNIVVSRREIMEETRAEQRAELLLQLEPGQLRMGVVKNITDFGAFVDLDGMDGLLHITDMSWGRVSHPSEVVKVGEEIEVMVLDVDRERQRVSLGIKQKEGNPWDTVDINYPQGSRVKGRVVNVMPYGAFVELEQGIEGLIHVSEMSWTKRINKASDVLNVGDEVEAVVLEVQKDARKLSLGLRQTMENPWHVLAEKFPKGSLIKGKVRNMTSYGAFVQIQDDIDGMIHISDMSWARKINHPSEMLQKGLEVEAVILEIDPDQQRISLGLKQLTDDPWSHIQDHYRVGNVVEGKVTKLTSFGAFVELASGIEGLVHISQLSEERVERVKDVIKVGDTVQARVVKLDADERRIGLSLKGSEGDEPEAREVEEAVSRGSLKPGQAMTSLGDLFDDAFSGLGADEASAPAKAAAPVEEAVVEETSEEEVEEGDKQEPTA